MHKTLNIDEKKLITQFICKSRDDFFKLSYSMIGQCLSNKKQKCCSIVFSKLFGTKQGLHLALFPSSSTNRVTLEREIGGGMTTRQ